MVYTGRMNECQSFPYIHSGASIQMIDKNTLAIEISKRFLIPRSLTRRINSYALYFSVFDNLLRMRIRITKITLFYLIVNVYVRHFNVIYLLVFD